MSGRQLTRDELEDRLDTLEAAVEDLQAEREQVQTRLNSMEGLVASLRSRNRSLMRLLIGRDGFDGLNPDNVVPLHDRVQLAEETLADHAEKFEMFVVEDGTQATPDERAMHLRQVLLNEARSNEDGIARLTRRSAGTVLGGGLHKGTVLDAMRRAADGHDANIDGASDLQPVDAIEFTTGGTVGRDGTASLSTITLDASRLTGPEARQILTTETEVQGGR